MKVHGVHLPDYDTHFSGHLQKELERYGKPGYQTKKRKAALQHVKHFGHAVDVGAHVGLWSMALVEDFQRVTAFEPVPGLRECFLQNLPTPNRATVWPYALGNKNGTSGIVEVEDNTGNAHIGGGRGVLMYKLDDLGFEILRERIDFLKIDVEGYELEVIRGGEKVIRLDKPVMIVEQKPGHGARYGFGDTEAIELLKSWGATVVAEISGDFILVWD